MTGRTITLLFAMVLMAGCAFAEMGPRIGPDKKIIHLPQSWPDAAYCRANVREMERLPFDGIGIWPYAEIDGKRENLWTRWFHPERIPEDLVADTVRNLKATEFRKFTDNFLYMASLCFPLDTPGWWDDDAWEKITANMALAARIARDCKLKGIMLDVEQYGESSHTYWFRFNYSDAHAKEKKLLAAGKIDRIHTWEEFAAGARRRGRQIMAAMCEVYPEITLISILGFHDVAKRGGQNRDADAWERDGLPISSYALLAPFTDGLMEGAAKEATIIDGAESAYPFKLNKQFVERRATIENAFDVSAVPDLYKKKMNVAFGLMLDYGYHSGRWHTDPGELHRNHFTPAQFGSALYFAMLNTDRYVWVWSELDGAVFLENVYGHWQDPAEHVKPTVPEEYLVEIGRAREPRDLATGTDHSAIANKPHRMKNAIYEKELETVLAATDKVFALPKDGWRFKMDWRDLGLGANWHLPTTATEDWLEIETEAFWGAKGGTGVGWYRRDIDVPVLPRGKRVYLHFGAVDEQIVLWIDGEHVGDYNRDPDEGWDQPFAIDVTGKLTTGKHHLAMRVDNRIAAGGIWKPVSVRAGGDTADAEEGL